MAMGGLAVWWHNKPKTNNFCATPCHLIVPLAPTSSIAWPEAWVSGREDQVEYVLRQGKTWALDLSGAGLPPSGFLDFFFEGKLVLAALSPTTQRGKKNYHFQPKKNSSPSLLLLRGFFVQGSKLCTDLDWTFLYIPRLFGFPKQSLTGSVSVLLCFIKPILGNRYGPGVSKRVPVFSSLLFCLLVCLFVKLPHRQPSREVENAHEWCAVVR